MRGERKACKKWRDGFWMQTNDDYPDSHQKPNNFWPIENVP